MIQLLILMALVFMSGGGDNTLGLQEWTTVSGTVSVDGTVAAPTGHTGPGRVKCDSGGTNALANCRKSGILGNAAGGRRINGWMQFSGAPTANADILAAWNAANSSVAFRVFLLTTGKLRITSGAVNTDGATTLSANTWYRICVSFNITSTTVHVVKVYLATDADPVGALEASETNQGTLSSAAPDILRLGWTGAVPGANLVIYWDDVTVDDVTDQSDMGDLRVTHKAPTTANVDTFDTVLGTGAVNERPVQTINGQSHAGTTAAQINYGIQDAATGDEDLTGATIVGYSGWILAAKGAGTGTPVDNITVNGTDTVVTLTTTSTYFSTVVTSAVYPSNAAGIGMNRTTGAAADCLWQEGGVLVAYTPGAAGVTVMGWMPEFQDFIPDPVRASVAYY